VFSALEVLYENALYKFTFDIGIDIFFASLEFKHCFDESVSCRLPQRPTVRNGNVAAKTGNTYTTGTMTDEYD